jgi:hypothetical protein
MSTLPSSTAAQVNAAKRGPGRPPGGNDLAKDNGREARRVAAMILEVLAGNRTTGDAALALGVSLTRYYILETRALQGLVAACEPRTQGRQSSPVAELQALRRDHERMKRELMRQQALVRAAQKTVGLTPPSPPAAKGKKQRRRRPVARALTVAERLQAADNVPAEGPPSASEPDPSTRR